MTTGVIGDIAAQWCDGWFERVEYFKPLPLKVNLVKKGEGAGSLHSDHPTGMRRIVEHWKQAPIITQLLEERWTRPVKAKDCERGSRALHAPLPGNLEDPDHLMTSMIYACQWIVLELNLAVRVLQGSTERRCAASLAAVSNAEHRMPDSVQADAYRRVAGPHQAAMTYLGYSWHPAVPLIDDQGRPVDTNGVGM